MSEVSMGGDPKDATRPPLHTWRILEEGRQSQEG
jgi:hypothetical protein